MLHRSELLRVRCCNIIPSGTVGQALSPTPADLETTINEDAGNLAETLSGLLPSVSSIVVKIEAIGKHGSCNLLPTHE